MSVPSIAIIVGSTRPGRRGDQIARWVLDQVTNRSDAHFSLVDLADHDLPLLDEAIPPVMRSYEHEHTKRWSAIVDRFDGFIIIAPEYNRSVPAALKNALDYLYHEWTNKAVGFVGYGATGGERVVEHLRTIVGELQMADVRAQVSVSLYRDFEEFQTFRPNTALTEKLHEMTDQLVAWTEALQTVRERQVAAAV